MASVPFKVPSAAAERLQALAQLEPAQAEGVG